MDLNGRQDHLQRSRQKQSPRVPNLHDQFQGMLKNFDVEAQAPKPHSKTQRNTNMVDEEGFRGHGEGSPYKSLEEFHKLQKQFNDQVEQNKQLTQRLQDNQNLVENLTSQLS